MVDQGVFITVDNTFFNRYRFLILYTVPTGSGYDASAPCITWNSPEFKTFVFTDTGYRSRFKTRKMPLYEFTQKDLPNEKPLNHI